MRGRKKPTVYSQEVPHETASMIKNRCSPIVRAWGAMADYYGLDHLILSIYTVGMLDGVQCAERVFGRSMDGTLPEPEDPLTSEVSNA